MRHSGQVACTPCSEGEGVRLTLRGPVSILLADELLQSAREAAEARAVTVDLSEAEHLDLAAWQVLLALQRTLAAADGHMDLVVASEPIRRFLAVSGLEAAFGLSADGEQGEA